MALGQIFGVAKRGEIFPPGNVTSLLFYQAAAPPGWTRDTTTAAANDAALRVMTTGTWVASFAGTNAASTLFKTGGGIASQTDAGGAPSHTHTTTAASDNFAANGGSDSGVPNDTTVNGLSVTSTGAPSGGTSAHSHDMEFDMKYIDLIIASKD